MKQLNSEELELLAQLGSNFMSLDDCAKILQIPAYEFKKGMMDETSPAYQAYWKAYMLSELEFRTALVGAAKRGVGPSVKELLNVLQKNRVTNR